METVTGLTLHHLYLMVRRSGVVTESRVRSWAIFKFLIKRFLPGTKRVAGEENFPANIITVILALYLFLTLNVVVEIINIFEAPLRHVN